MNREELIQAYWKNKLDKEGKVEFDHLFETDPEFRKEVEFHQDMNAAFSAMDRERVKRKLQEFETQINAEQQQKKYKWWLAAACILVIVGVSLTTFFGGSETPNQLYADYFEPYPNVIVPTVRNAETSEEANVAAAFNYYDNRQYADAATAFYKLYQADSKDYAFFYHSVSLMAVGNTQKAITTLESHRWNEPENYQTMTHWYLGLGYLKLQDKEKAITHLEKVANSSKPLAKQAKEIIQKLK